MTILWIYNMPLVPEAGGTERITSLVAKGLTRTYMFSIYQKYVLMTDVQCN